MAISKQKFSKLVCTILETIGFKIYYFKSFIAGGYTLLGRGGLV